MPVDDHVPTVRRVLSSVSAPAASSSATISLSPSFAAQCSAVSAPSVLLAPSSLYGCSMQPHQQRRTEPHHRTHINTHNSHTTYICRDGTGKHAVPRCSRTRSHQRLCSALTSSSWRIHRKTAVWRARTAASRQLVPARSQTMMLRGSSACIFCKSASRPSLAAATGEPIANAAPAASCGSAEAGRVVMGWQTEPAQSSGGVWALAMGEAAESVRRSSRCNSAEPPLYIGCRCCSGVRLCQGNISSRAGAVRSQKERDPRACE